MAVPGSVAWHCASEDELPGNDDWLSDTERSQSAGMRFSKRRDDCLLGRYTAKRAVARALGLPGEPASLGRIEIRNRREGAERGAPELYLDGAPSLLGVSLSDRAGWAVCAVHPRHARLGCDLELVEPRSPAFVADYLTAPERGFVAAADDDEERALRANLVWCAKESALKVLRCGLRRDTRSVEVAIEAPPAPGDWGRLCVDAGAGAPLHGWWRRFGHFVVTLASDVGTGRPRALAATPPLETARPSHRWLDRPLAAPPQRGAT